MIESRVRICTGGRKGARRWIIKIRVETCCRRVLIVERSASCQNLAVCENGRTHLDARLRHVWSVVPGGRGGSKVDELSRGRRRIAAAQDEDTGIIIVGRCEGKQYGCTVRA